MNDLEARTLCIDLDHTLCIAHGDYAEAEPMSGAQEALRRLRGAGWIVVVYTGRHFNHWQTTVEWLADRGFVYDQLVFGKPPARFYIDDRGIPFTGDWEAVCGRVLKTASMEVAP